MIKLKKMKGIQRTEEHRIDLHAFLARRSKVLSIYVPAGYPEIDSLPHVLRILEESGVNMVEIGIPYSDPLADGPVIQACHTRALANGMTLRLLFDQLASVQTRIPLLLMGYFNVVLQFGVERFCKSCVDHGVSGVIIPDLPIDEYVIAYQQIFIKHRLNCVFMITPQTSDQRIRHIDSVSTGFIYAVSSASTTGTGRSQLSQEYLRRLHDMQLLNPVLTGFNITDNAAFSQATTYTRGAIIGSAFLQHLSTSEDLTRDIPSFIANIKGNDHTA